MATELFQICVLLAIIGLLMSCCLLKRRGICSNLCGRFYNWFTFGIVLDLVIALYLPTCMHALIGLASLDWQEDRMTGTILANNLVTVALATFVLLLPIVVFYSLYKHRHLIG
jgi:hypothetical protein